MGNKVSKALRQIRESQTRMAVKANRVAEVCYAINLSLNDLPDTVTTAAEAVRERLGSDTRGLHRHLTAIHDTLRAHADACDERHGGAEGSGASSWTQVVNRGDIASQLYSEGVSADPIEWGPVESFSRGGISNTILCQAPSPDGFRCTWVKDHAQQPGVSHSWSLIPPWSSTAQRTIPASVFETADILTDLRTRLERIESGLHEMREANKTNAGFDYELARQNMESVDGLRDIVKQGHVDLTDRLERIEDGLHKTWNNLGQAVDHIDEGIHDLARAQQDEEDDKAEGTFDSDGTWTLTDSEGEIVVKVSPELRYVTIHQPKFGGATSIDREGLGIYPGDDGVVDRWHPSWQAKDEKRDDLSALDEIVTWLDTEWHNLEDQRFPQSYLNGFATATSYVRAAFRRRGGRS